MGANLITRHRGAPLRSGSLTQCAWSTGASRGHDTHQQHAMAPGLMGQTIERAPRPTQHDGRLKPIPADLAGLWTSWTYPLWSPDQSSGRPIVGSELESAVAALYRPPVAEFATAVTSSPPAPQGWGPRRAPEVVALRRPSASVWGTNQLPSAAPRARRRRLRHHPAASTNDDGVAAVAHRGRFRRS